MVGSKPTDAASITIDNIIKPTFKELSEGQCQAYEERKKERQAKLDTLKKQHDEEFEALQRKTEEEDLDLFLATFKKDRQGIVTCTGELKLTPLAENPSEKY